MNKKNILNYSDSILLHWNFWQSNPDLLFGGITIVCGILGTLAGGLILDSVNATINNAFKVSSACDLGVWHQNAFFNKIYQNVLLKPFASSTASLWSNNSRCNLLLQCLLCKELVFFCSSFLNGGATCVCHTGNLKFYELGWKLVVSLRAVLAKLSCVIVCLKK